jgi:hypothetical protein
LPDQNPVLRHRIIIFSTHFRPDPPQKLALRVARGLNSAHLRRLLSPLLLRPQYSQPDHEIRLDEIERNDMKYALHMTATLAAVAALGLMPLTVSAQTAGQSGGATAGQPGTVGGTTNGTASGAIDNPSLTGQPTSGVTSPANPTNTVNNTAAGVRTNSSTVAGQPGTTATGTGSVTGATDMQPGAISPSVSGQATGTANSSTTATVNGGATAGTQTTPQTTSKTTKSSKTKHSSTTPNN